MESNLKAIYMQPEYKAMLKELAESHKQSESAIVKQLIANAHYNLKVEEQK